ncbi:MAG: T9SS type A sorting domain-containing protein [Chitinophagales bacterium]
MKKSILTISLFCTIITLFAQPIPYSDITLEINGETPSNTWAGGLDLPQFSGADIDGDSDEDLIVFDRKGQKWLCFLNDGNYNYEYTTLLDTAFPDVINMGIMRDYNCDGKADIFAHANGGIKVYQNTSDNGVLEFTLVEDLIEFWTGFAYLNLYKYNYDIPAIEDFDGDGDMDILSFDLLGTTIPYYINLSVENGYGCDSLIYEEYTTCWGNFRESSSDNTVELDYMCKGNSGLEENEATPRHVGSTLCAFDPDKDNDKDLLLGDISFNNLIYLDNGGTNTDADMISFSNDFPSYDTPVDVEIFPAAYYLDVTGDGEQDILVTPNAPTTHVNQKNVFLYENDGSTSENFSFVQDDFLVNTMLDIGNNSFPVFFDHNADGLDDLIVSNGYIYNNDASTDGAVYYFENTGTAEEPHFTYVTDDYASLISTYDLEFIRPAFYDMDNDGDTDMFIGESSGAIHYFKNTAGAGNEAAFALSQLNYATIDIGSFSHPIVHDINEDGLPDLIVGGGLQFGAVAYYRNFGTLGIPEFHYDTVNMTLGNIQVVEPGFIQGYSAPYVHETDTTDYLFVGSLWGYIYQYAIDTDSLENGTFATIDSSILDVRAGLRTTIAINDINNDNNLDYFVGNSRGGLHLYSDTTSSDTIVINPPDTTGMSIRNPSLFNFEIYPNPSNHIVNISMDETNDFSLEIYDVIGAKIHAAQFNTTTYNIDVSTFAKGIYTIHITAKDKQYHSQKLIIH